MIRVWLFVALFLFGVGRRDMVGEDARSVTSQVFEKRSFDDTEGRLEIDPELNDPFFRTMETVYGVGIVEGSDGELRDLLDGEMNDGDEELLEVTSNCRSSHQGDHEMKFCSAEFLGGQMELVISGDAPAYFSELRILLGEDGGVECGFEAVYPDPSAQPSWRMTSTKVVLREWVKEAGIRLYGFVDVEFVETANDGVTVVSTHRINGMIKPTIREPVKG